MDDLYPDPLGSYTPVHSGVAEGAFRSSPPPPSVPAAPTDSSLAGKIDQLLYETRSLGRTVEELKREMEAIHAQLIHHS